MTATTKHLKYEYFVIVLHYKLCRTAT